MNRLRRIARSATVIAGAALSVSLAACSSSGSSATETAGTSSSSGGASGQHYVIGYSNPEGSQTVLTAAQDAFTAIADRYGWTVKALDANLNASTQAEDIDQFTAEHVNAIVFTPAGSMQTLMPALQRAKAAGIKLVGVTATLAPSDPIAPLDANLDTGGMYGGTKALVALVKQDAGDKGNVLGVGLGVPVQFLQILVQQYQDQLAAQAPAMKWIGLAENPTDDINGAEKVVAEALTAHHNDIQAVLAYNDDSAIGAAIAFKNAGVKNPIIVGQNGDSDAVQAVESGEETATNDIVPWRQGLMSAALVKGLLDGKKVPAWSTVPDEVYTKQNIGTRLDWQTAISEIQSGKLDCATGGCPANITALS